MVLGGTKLESPRRHDRRIRQGSALSELLSAVQRHDLQRENDEHFPVAWQASNEITVSTRRRTRLVAYRKMIAFEQFEGTTSTSRITAS